MTVVPSLRFGHPRSQASAWERTSGKLCFSRMRSRASGTRVPKRELGNQNLELLSFVILPALSATLGAGVPLIRCASVHSNPTYWWAAARLYFAEPARCQIPLFVVQALIA